MVEVGGTCQVVPVGITGAHQPFPLHSSIGAD